MTLSELVETCGHIGLIEATVRGTAQNEHQRVCEYRIGARATYYPGDYRHGTNADPDPAVHVIQKPIHVRDDGASNFEFGQLIKNIPIKIRMLEVTRWSCRNEYLGDTNWWGERPYHLTCDLLSEEWAKKRRGSR